MFFSKIIFILYIQIKRVKREILKIFAAIVFCCLVNLSAQNNIFRNLTVAEGLPDDHVKSIIQDAKGFIWIGTQNGLTRFDGKEFRTFRNNPNDKNTLSNNGVWVLSLGKSGCIWIGTKNGSLDKYEPDKNIFRHFNICGSSDAENYISSLFEDEEGNIWAGTYNKGLYKFNPESKSVEHWIHNDNDPNSLSNDFINAIVPDDSGNLLIGTYAGLNIFNYKKNKNLFKKYFEYRLNNGPLTSNIIWNITRSKINPDLFYIATYMGITLFNSNDETFQKLIPLKNPLSQFSNSIGSVVEKKSNSGTELWLGSYSGLINFNLSTKKILEWHHVKRISGSLVGDQINDLLLDNSGVLWIATEDGISCLPEKELKFSNNILQNFTAADKKNIDELNIQALAQIKNGAIYIGTTKGLKFITPGNNYPRLVAVPEFEGINIWSLAEGKPGILWIGTYGKGLYKLNTESKKIYHITFHSPTERITPYNYVKSIYEDSSGLVWAGFWGGGLAVVNTKTGNQKIFRSNLNSSSGISFNDVWKIYPDSYGRMWIGTNGGGLNLVHRKKNLFKDLNMFEFFKVTDKKLKIICKNILSICEQKNNLTKKNITILWIGTADGLCRLEIKNTKVFDDYDDIIVSSKRYTVNDGLSNDVISQIVEDDSGNLWLATNSGLTKFIVKNKKFINFSAYDGLSGNNFSSGALIKSKDGIIYAGNNSGLNIFRPEDIHQSGFQPKILFTGFYVNNKRVTISNNSFLKIDIAYTKKIVLSYNRNTFTIYFSSDDYNAPSLIKYSYLLYGFNKDWVPAGSRNYAAFTNLNSGKYIFNVKSTNSDEASVETPAEMEIIIMPPWWRTVWAYALYVFLIAAGLLAIRKFQINRAELRNELKMREFETKKLQELENLKSRFFANLSHEFRTPLMLIKGPVEQLINEFSQKNLWKNGYEEQMKMIYRNSQKLQNLIDQLLELSQLEAASIPLKARQENLIIIVKGILQTFEYMSKQKNIKLLFNCNKDSITAWIDRDKLEKIINNLLSNAFKFTNANGTITVSTGLNDADYAEVKISDTGIGIPEDKLDKIFNRFYQADDSPSKSFGGSGIGLALVKELVELHKWRISVQSEPGKGTEFILSIPLRDSYLDENEKIYEKNIQINTSLIQDEVSIKADPGNGKDELLTASGVPVNSTERSLILIVEDSYDVRKYLSGLLASGFQMGQLNMALSIIEAENGKEGLKTAIEKMPDLIISDIMMPVMDGIEFCAKVKTTWETSHIPVILLTAKVSFKSKIEGLETGADDYLTKPFDSKELFVRVKNLLKLRRQLKEKFSREIKISADAVTTTSIDNEFLKKALALTERNISNSGFDAEAFAREMFLSRSQLHRKLLALTGKAPGEFIRLIRLKHAARLLLQKNLSITQVALEIGFNSPSHFTKAFHNQFGCLPSEFSELCNKSAKV